MTSKDTLDRAKKENLRLALAHIGRGFEQIRSAREKTVNDEWQRLDQLSLNVLKCMNMVRNERWFDGKIVYTHVHRQEDSNDKHS